MQSIPNMRAIEMMYKVSFFKNLSLAFIMLFAFNLKAQTPNVVVAKPEKNPQAAAIDANALNKEAPISYFPRLMQSYAVSEDGFPLAEGQFDFSQNELQNLNEINVVKFALKREQRKLTREYFEQNILFNHLPKEILEKHILETSKKIDESIDNNAEFRTLNYFSFDTYRAHLFRVSMFKLFQGQGKYKLVETAGTKFSINTLIPKTPFEVIAILSLMLNLIVLGFFIKHKYI